MFPPNDRGIGMRSASARNFPIVFAIIIASALIRFVGIGEKQLWMDEIIQVIHSSPDSVGKILEDVAGDKGDAPLDYIVQHYAMKAAGGRSEVSARLHAALFGSISIALIYLLSIRLLGHSRIAILSAALYGFYPFHHHYSQEGRPYALFVMLVLALFILYIRARTQFSWSRLLALFLLSALSFYTHPFTAFVFAAMVSVDILRLALGRVQPAERALTVPLAAFLFGACAWAPWLLYSVRNARGDYYHPLSLRLIPEAVKGLGDGSYPVAIMLFLLAGFGAAYLLKNNRAVLIDLSCWTLVPIPLVLFLIYWRSYFFAIRQLLFVTPAIIILAACGVERLLCVYREKAWALPAVYALACLAVIGLHYPDRRPDLRAVGGYLKHTVGQGDAVVAPNSLGLLSYYFPDIYSYGRELSSVGPNSNCRRLFLIEAPYAGAVSQSQLWSIEKRMALQSRLSYRGMDVYVFVSKALK